MFIVLALLTGAFLAGLAGSPHCMGMCGPFAMACAGNVRRTSSWHLGRITTYAVLGSIAGAAGTSLPGPAWLATAISLLLVAWFAAALAGLVPEPALAIPGLAGRAGKLLADGTVASSFAFGVANGLLPCGLVYAALGMSVVASGPLWGAAVIAAFGLGTVPSLTALSALRSTLMKRMWSRKVLAALVFAAGLWVVGQRAGWWP